MATINYFSWEEHPVGEDQLDLKGMCLDEEIDSRLVSWTNNGKPFYLVLVLQGDCVCIPPGRSEPEDASDSIMIWTPGTARTYGSPNRRWKHSWMILNGEIVRGAIARGNLATDRPLPFPNRDVFNHYVKLLHAELRAFRPPDNVILGGLIKLFFYELARSLNRNVPPIPEHLIAVSSYMESHLDEDLGARDLARMASLSVSGFITQFKHHYGKTPMEYLTELRMNAACQLLLRRHLTIKEVAAAVGFPDQLYFSRRFRQFFHRSPSEYKSNADCR